MLSPDLEVTKQYLRTNDSAASTATKYAQATISSVPTLKNPPDWFAPIQSHLTVSQNHAKNWLREICPNVTNSVPQGIVDFSSSFQNTSGQMLNILQEIQSSGGQPSSQQRIAVSALFNDLNTIINKQETVLDSLQGEIKAYSANIKTDQDDLAEDLGIISAKFANSQIWIQQLTAAISENFLDCTALGPCAAIVEIDMNISLKVEGIGSDPSLITLVFAKAILENQTGNSQMAQQAVQSVLDTWTTLKAKNEAVISDFNDAQDSQYINILIQVDLETAQTQWQQLADFASGLIQT